MANITFADIYKELEELYIPYDILYKGEARKLVDIKSSASIHSIEYLLSRGNKEAEQLIAKDFLYLCPSDVEYEFLIKLLYRREELYDILLNEKEFDIEPNHRFVELTFNSINLADEDGSIDITEYNDKLWDLYCRKMDPFIVDYVDLLHYLDINKIPHSFKSISEMNELVRDEGIINPNPVIKSKILKRVIH